jgi:hypothetical protein
VNPGELIQRFHFWDAYHMPETGRGLGLADSLHQNSTHITLRRVQ